MWAPQAGTMRNKPLQSSPKPPLIPLIPPFPFHKDQNSFLPSWHPHHYMMPPPYPDWSMIHHPRSTPIHPVRKPAHQKKKKPGRPKLPQISFLEAYPTKTFSAQELQALLPADWSPTCVADFTRCGVLGHDATLSDVVGRFRPVWTDVERSGLRVTRIEWVQNPFLWLLFGLRGCEVHALAKDSAATVTDRLLYHGTDVRSISSIIRDNFNYRLTGRNRQNRFGRGVNFSSNARFCGYYSTQGQVLILAAVLQGGAHVGDAATILPMAPCDSTTNGRDIVVKFHDHEFYPALLVHYLHDAQIAPKPYNYAPMQSTMAPPFMSIQTRLRF